MKIGLLSLAACAGAIATSAVAQVTPSPAGFTLHSDAETCSVASAPGNPSGMAITAGYGIDGRAWLRVSGEGWPFAADTGYPIRIRTVSSTDHVPSSDPRDEARVGARGFRDSAGWGGIAIAGGPTALAASTFALYRGEEAEPFALIFNPIWARSSDLRNCLTRLARTDHGSGKPAATRPRPRYALDRYFSNSDFPDHAVPAGFTAVTEVSLTISAHGIPSDCAVTRTSGNTLFDSTSCSILVRRARFAPARDAAGDPTESAFVTRVRWQNPGE